MSRLNKIAKARRDRLEEAMIRSTTARERLTMAMLRIRQAQERSGLADLLEPAFDHMVEVRAEIREMQNIMEMIWRECEQHGWEYRD